MWNSMHSLLTEENLILRTLPLTADFGILAHLSTVWDIIEISSDTLLETCDIMGVFLSGEERDSGSSKSLHISLRCIFPSYFLLTLYVSFLQPHPAIYHSCHFSLPLPSFSLAFLLSAYFGFPSARARMINEGEKLEWVVRGILRVGPMLF